jgi:hypothetical protein
MTRLMYALELFPMDETVSDSLRLAELLPTAILQPKFKSASFRLHIQRQHEYELAQERLERQLTDKYQYLFQFIRNELEYPHAIRMYHEMCHQMMMYYHRRLDAMTDHVNEIFASRHMWKDMWQDDSEFTKSLSPDERSICSMIKMLDNRLYTKTVFVEQWMKAYPDTEQDELENELEISYVAFNTMMGKSPKTWHLEQIDTMNSAIVDAIEDWFVTPEQYQRDRLERPELIGCAF